MGFQMNLTQFAISLNDSAYSSAPLWNFTGNQTANSTESGDCDWGEAQHMLFQVANLCLFIAFIVPKSFQYHVDVLRSMFCLGTLFFLLWGSTVVCQPDVLGWYLVFFLINCTHLVFLMHLHWPVRINPELEEVYTKMFKPLKVDRSQFSELTCHGLIKDLPNGATYALENATHTGEKVSILLSGRLKVTCENLYLHTIEPNQFADSPEYESTLPGSDEEDCFQISIRATEDSRLLTWTARDVSNFLKSRPYMNSVFFNLLGKDITHKLYQVQEMLLQHPQYVKVIASRNSVVHVQHKLSENQEMELDLEGLVRTTSPCSVTSDEYRDPMVSGVIGVMTPIGPYSPSQLSFETCV